MIRHIGGILDGRQCPGCGGKKSEGYRLCRACYDKYGRESREWPKWLRDLANHNDKLRYEAKKRAKNEISLDVFRTLVERAKTLVPGDRFIDYIITDRVMAISRRPKGDPWWPGTDHGWILLLPYAPYEQKQTNEDYRRSNGITEKVDAIDYANPIKPEDDEAIWEEGYETLENVELSEQVLTEAEAALTTRQKQVVNLLAKPTPDDESPPTQQEVARALGINQSTVSRHWTVALEKILEIGKRYA